jgi:hypothetical protein
VWLALGKGDPTAPASGVNASHHFPPVWAKVVVWGKEGQRWVMVEGAKTTLDPDDTIRQLRSGNLEAVIAEGRENRF